MSRSFKKNPAGGIAKCESEKDDKRFANRKLRRINKREVDNDKEVFTEKREASNIWSFGKDGKVYWNEIDKKWLRK